MTRAIMLIIGAALLWGVTAGVLTGLQANGLATGAIIMLVVMWPLLIRYAILRARLPAASYTRPPWRGIFLMTGVETISTGCSYYALHTAAPVGVVVALSYAVPVMLLVYALVSRQRTLDPRYLAIICLISLALVIIGLQRSPHHQTGSLWLGVSLSVVSALVWAFTIGTYKQMMSTVHAPADKNLILGCMAFGSGILLSPALGLWLPHWHTVLIIAAIALGCIWPASVMAATALKHLSAVTYTTVVSLSPFVATVTANLLYDRPIRPIEIVSVLCITAAIILETTAPTPVPVP